MCLLKFHGIVIGWVPAISFGGSFHVYTFFLTADVPHGTLGLALCLVGMHSEWALTKFSYSSFGVGVFDISLGASNLFFSVIS